MSVGIDMGTWGGNVGGSVGTSVGVGGSREPELRYHLTIRTLDPGLTRELWIGATTTLELPAETPVVERAAARRQRVAAVRSWRTARTVDPALSLDRARLHRDPAGARPQLIASLAPPDRSGGRRGLRQRLRKPYAGRPNRSASLDLREHPRSGCGGMRPAREM
jgi:hypothetical protein